MVFGWGYLTAREKNLGNDFLRGYAVPTQPPTAEDIRKQNEILRIQEKSGSLSAYNLIDGQWWRLLTAGFVHFGFLHLLMNVVFLYLIGRFVEPMWGHLRYLSIYLASVLGGSCLGVVHNFTIVSSASDAVCGLLVAEVVWFVFNRRYLPRAASAAHANVSPHQHGHADLHRFFQGCWRLGDGGRRRFRGDCRSAASKLHRFGPPMWRWLATPRVRAAAVVRPLRHRANAAHESGMAQDRG